MSLKPRVFFALDSILPAEPGSKHTTGFGGVISNTLLIGYLKKHLDAHILLDDPSKPIGSIKSDGVTFHNVRVFKLPKTSVLNELAVRKSYRKSLRVLIQSLKPSAVVTATYLIGAAERAASEAGIPTIAWIRAYENFYDSKYIYQDGIYHRMKGLAQRSLFRREDASAIRRCRVILANSHYMKSVADREFGIQSRVIYPPIDMGSYSQIRRSEENVVGFIKPEPKKGLQIVCEIAQRMPDFKFLCFGKAPALAEAISRRVSNIRFMGWANDPTKLFSSIKILIVPSLWPEPFGRVAIEALASNVLPIVSGCGGLPEAVNNQNLIVVEPHDIDEWTLKIRSYSSDPAAYRKDLDKSGKCLSRFSIEEQGREMKDILIGMLS